MKAAARGQRPKIGLASRCPGGRWSGSAGEGRAERPPPECRLQGEGASRAGAGGRARGLYLPWRAPPGAAGCRAAAAAAAARAPGASAAPWRGAGTRDSGPHGWPRSRGLRAQQAEWGRGRRAGRGPGLTWITFLKGQ